MSFMTRNGTLHEKSKFTLFEMVSNNFERLQGVKFHHFAPLFFVEVSDFGFLDC
jgi:hypothetical protein